MEFDNILNKKYLNYQDYECIKTLIHKCSDVEVRNNMLLDVFSKNPYFGAKIFTSMNGINDGMKVLIDKKLIDIKNESDYRKKDLVLAYLELKKYDDFYKYFIEFENQFDRNIYEYFGRNLSCNQILCVLNAMTNVNNILGWKILTRYIKSIYTSNYDEDVIKIILKLLEKKKYEECFILAIAVKIDCKLNYLIDEESKNRFINELSMDIKNKSRYSLYLSLKYGFSNVCTNSDTVINNVIEDVNHPLGKRYYSFFKRLDERSKMNDEQKKRILLKMGCTKRTANTIIEKESFGDIKVSDYKIVRNLYEVIDNTEESIKYIDKSIQILSHPFITMEKISIPNDAANKDRSIEYSLFNQYMAKDQDVYNIVFMYFNSLFRYIVDFEYVVHYIKDRFLLNENELKKVFEEYIFGGRVCRINENSISIRVKNVLTLRAFRMDISKSCIERNGGVVTLKLKDDFYFKFDYMLYECSKIYVCSPALIIEEM